MVAGSKKLSTGERLRLIGPVVLYAILAFVGWKRGYFQARNFEAAAHASSSSLWIGAVFVLFYGTFASLALPVSPLAYAAGAIFGFSRGSILVWIASMLGAVSGYYMARGVLAKPARRLLGRYKDKLENLRGEKAFIAAIRMRLVPIVPFGAFTYAGAIGNLEALPFFAGTAVGIIPGTLLATFVGDRVAAGFYGESKRPYIFAVGGMLLLLGISFAPKLWDKFRNRRKG